MFQDVVLTRYGMIALYVILAAKQTIVDMSSYRVVYALSRTLEGCFVAPVCHLQAMLQLQPQTQAGHSLCLMAQHLPLDEGLHFFLRRGGIMRPLIFLHRDGIEWRTDIYTVMLLDRIIMLDTGIDDGTATHICGQLLFLEAQAPGKPISLYINSPGGVVTAGLAIYDTMQHISSPVRTLVMGQAASMAAVLLCAGTGGRAALPNARIMVHQPSGGFKGQASDAEIHTTEMLRLKSVLNRIISSHAGIPLEQVEALTDRDSFLTAQEAMRMGLIDGIVKN